MTQSKQTLLLKYFDPIYRVLKKIINIIILPETKKEKRKEKRQSRTMRVDPLRAKGF